MAARNSTRLLTAFTSFLKAPKTAGVHYGLAEGRLVLLNYQIRQARSWVEDQIRKHAVELPIRFRWREEHGRIAHTCTVFWSDDDRDIVSICIPVCYLYMTEREDPELERYVINRIRVALKASGKM